MNNQKQTLKEASEALKEASSIMDSMIQHYCQNAWNRIDPCQYERQMMNWASIAESIQETHEEADQTTTAPPTKLVLITYQSFKEEAIPYSIEALEFVAAHHDCIDSIRIVELRSL